jgi:tetratricopeptide (TPR) repeat protein
MTKRRPPFLFRAALAAFCLVVAACAPAKAPETASADIPADPALAQLFVDLAAASDVHEAGPIEEQIWRTWAHSGSETVNVLMTRSQRAMAAGDVVLARRFLDQVTALTPRYAGGWYQSAMLRLNAEDIPGALADIQTTLKYEPRHFAAMTYLGMLYEELGQEEKALTAYREALLIHPQMEEAKQGVARLEPKLEGRET